MPKIPEEIKLKWVDLFLKGHTVTNISRITGNARYTISKELNKRRLRPFHKTPKQRKLTNKTPLNIMRLVEKGLTDKEIRQELRISQVMISRYRKQYGFSSNRANIEKTAVKVWRYLWYGDSKTQSEIIKNCKTSFYTFKDLLLLDIIIPLDTKTNNKIQASRGRGKYKTPVFYQANTEYENIFQSMADET